MTLDSFKFTNKYNREVTYELVETKVAGQTHYQILYQGHLSKDYRSNKWQAEESFNKYREIFG